MYIVCNSDLCAFYVIKTLASYRCFEYNQIFITNHCKTYANACNVLVAAFDIGEIRTGSNALRVWNFFLVHECRQPLLVKLKVIDK